MREALLKGSQVPTGAEILTILDRLPAEVMQLPTREPWSAGVDRFAQVIKFALPEAGDLALRIADRVTSRTSGLAVDSPVHGDFYEAQLMLTGSVVTGVLDVDSAGPGRRADDLACMVAHIETLATLRGWDSTRLQSLAREYWRDFSQVVEPRELNARIAGVLLSMATGPFRVQEPNWQRATMHRLQLAKSWLDS
jgi:aminoglycoside phosphotransferase (APT) family kinase protein